MVDVIVWPIKFRDDGLFTCYRCYEGVSELRNCRQYGWLCPGCREKAIVEYLADLVEGAIKDFPTEENPMSNVSRAFRRTTKGKPVPPTPKVLAEPRLNRYGCAKCGFLFVTKDIHDGVTYASIECPKCQSMAWSKFYTKMPPNSPEPMYIFRVPTAEEYHKLPEVVKQHVDQGGLLHYPVEK